MYGSSSISHGRSLRSSSLGLSSEKQRTIHRVLVTVLILGIVGACVGAVDSFVVGSRPLSKRSFFDIQCKGVYDKGIFAKLDRVCDDCYNLYREPQLHALCSQKCFSTSYFVGCLDALTLSDDEQEYQQLITAINANNPLG